MLESIAVDLMHDPTELDSTQRYPRVLQCKYFRISGWHVEFRYQFDVRFNSTRAARFQQQLSLEISLMRRRDFDAH
jgi:hypothetical protein